jgi:asparagine synthase (glutamine-hydrolysing)
MCGIAGFWDHSGSLNREQMTRRVGRMTNSLVHRGPDAGGLWLDAEAGVALGHRRLAILDLSPGGSQPMRSRCGRYVISFNGEIYNYRTLREDLASVGHSFRGTSDTEVMLAAIAEWGIDRALERFNGMFAFALWDAVARQLHLARDRAGEKPLYYGRMKRTVVFGSELKALRAHPGFDAEIDRDALALYVRHGYIPAPHTIYSGIHKLPAGAVLTLSPRDPDALPEPRFYWRLRDAAESGLANMLSGSPEDAAAELDALLRDAIGLRMEADVPLGAFLSGGVDSSTIVAIMQAQSARRVRTFTVGFSTDSYNEAHQAGEVAKHLGTEHTELYVTPADAMAVIPRLGAIYDEPFADSSQIPTVLVSELARRHVTVSLSGDGGDELFGGYTRYVWAERIWRKMRAVPGPLRKVASRTLTGLSVQQWESAFRRLKHVLPAQWRQRNPGEKLHKLAETLGAGSAEAMYLALVSQWKDPDSVVIGAREPGTPLSDPGGHFGCADFVPLMMYADTAAYLPDDLLVKIDRASMSVGLEARAPLLDHRLIEFAWRMPQSLKIRDGRGKWLLRRVLDKYVPKNLTERPKMGFDVPIDGWLRGPLRGWAEELIGEGRLRSEGFFEPQPIKQKWTEHVTGARNWQDSVWNILMFQAWLDETRSSPTREIDDVVSAVAK